jgi:glycosyltransferase involved in cell wall biosynthesis
MDLSVVVPVYNEEENLAAVIEELDGVLAAMGRRYEVIVVDDGSTDGSDALLKRLHRQYPSLKVIRLKRNFGQTAALAAGLAHARGEIVVPMDGDGQNDPRDSPRLVEKLEEGFDLVSGWRRVRRDPWLRRRLPSHLANWLISRITGVRLHDYGCTLKALRGELARELRLYGEMHRFIPALAYERGARIVELDVNHRRRERGRSKYGLGRTLRVLLDLLTVKFFQRYATRPLHVFGPLGAGCAALGFLIGLYLSAQKLLYGAEIGTRPLLLLGVLLIVVGLQFVSIGLLGEMLSRTYYESQNKPIYAVREILD